MLDYQSLESGKIKPSTLQKRAPLKAYLDHINVQPPQKYNTLSSSDKETMNKRIKQQNKLETGAYPQPLSVSNKVSTKKSIKQI